MRGFLSRVWSRRAAREHNFHPSYRPDVDGLRALAILAVVGFHAFPGRIHGGFIGVDVFFVISGFLISSILYKSLGRGDFRFTEFYAHRIKRIFPALSVVLAASLVLGWFALLPDEFTQLGKHMAAGAGFILNFVLLREAGYFDVASELKPLMHLWSLAIEEQFYLVFPLILWGAWRLGFNLLSLVVLGALVSFGVNVVWVHAHPVWAFFLPFARFWELLAGAVLAHVVLFHRAAVGAWIRRWAFHPWVFAKPPAESKQDTVLNNTLAGLGFGLIVVSALVLRSTWLFPGGWAALPVLGACLLIWAGPAAFVNRFVLANPVVVFIGLISYPLYLWHWPLLSFLHIAVTETPSWKLRGGALALSALLATLTYFLIEKPIRFGRKTWIKTVGLCAGMILLGAAGWGLYLKKGFPERFANFDATFATAVQTFSVRSTQECRDGLGKAYTQKADGINDYTWCVSTESPDRATVAVLGDSHAYNLYHGLRANLDEQAWPLVLLGHSVCPPIVNAEKVSRCTDPDSVRTAIAFIAKTPTIRTVILASYWTLASLDHPAFQKGLEDTVQLFRQHGKRVILVKDWPELPFLPGPCAHAKLFYHLVQRSGPCTLTREAVDAQRRLYKDHFEALRKAYPETVTIFDAGAPLCDDSLCWVFKGNRLFYTDDNHLTLGGAAFVSERLIPLLQTSAPVSSAGKTP